MRFRPGTSGLAAAGRLLARPRPRAAPAASAPATTTAAAARSRSRSWSTTRTRTSRTAEQLAKDFTAKNPEHHGQGRDPAGRHRGRQHRQDPAVHRRHGRRLHLQLRLAVPGDRAGEEPASRSTTSRGSATLDENFKKTVTADGQVYGAPSAASMGGAVLYNRPVYAKLGPAGAEDLGRVHGQQRQDQGGRRRRAGHPDLPGHLDLAAVRARRLPQRRRGRAGLRRQVHEEPGEVRRPRRPR